MRRPTVAIAIAVAGAPALRYGLAAVLRRSGAMGCAASRRFPSFRPQPLALHAKGSPEPEPEASEETAMLSFLRSKHGSLLVEAVLDGEPRPIVLRTAPA